MKKILLSSAAVALLAGAASAEVTWSGDAELGYNDDFTDGFFWDAGLGVKLSQDLDNGWTAFGSLDIDLESSDSSTYKLGDVESSDWVVGVKNEMLSISFGDVDTAYEGYNGVSKLYDNDLFAPNDEAADYDDSAAGVLVAAEYGQFDAAVSFVIVDQDEDNTDVNGGNVVGDLTNGDGEYMQARIGAEFGMIRADLFFAEDVAFNTAKVTNLVDTDVAGKDDLTVLTLAAAFAGADVALSVADYGNNTHFGVEASYPVGPVTLGGFFTAYDLDDANEDKGYGISAAYNEGPIVAKVYYEEILGEQEYGLGATYDMGNGLKLTGGYIDGDDSDDDDFATYIAADYDLGGGASILASYADANNAAAKDTDDIDTATGGYELKSGATIALNLEF